jgi:hypothetical protein
VNALCFSFWKGGSIEFKLTFLEYTINSQKQNESLFLISRKAWRSTIIVFNTSQVTRHGRQSISRASIPDS